MNAAYLSQPQPAHQQQIPFVPQYPAPQFAEPPNPLSQVRQTLEFIKDLQNLQGLVTPPQPATGGERGNAGGNAIAVDQPAQVAAQEAAAAALQNSQTPQPTANQQQQTILDQASLATEQQIINGLRGQVEQLTQALNAQATEIDKQLAVINEVAALMNDPDFMLWHAFQVWKGIELTPQASQEMTRQFAELHRTNAPWMNEAQQQVAQPQQQNGGFPPNAIAPQQLQQYYQQAQAQPVAPQPQAPAQQQSDYFGQVPAAPQLMGNYYGPTVTPPMRQQPNTMQAQPVMQQVPLQQLQQQQVPVPPAPSAGMQQPAGDPFTQMLAQTKQAMANGNGLQAMRQLARYM